jgi:hypothetical protein
MARYIATVEFDPHFSGEPPSQPLSITDGDRRCPAID